MSIKHLYEDERPTLLLDFANSKTLDPRITFTRNSTATYVDEQGIIRTAAAGEARFDHDPVTGECLGLLIEESKTNYFQDSDSNTTSKWNPYTGVTITQSTSTAPDGSTNAIRIQATTSGRYAERSWVAPSTSNYTATIYIRSRTGADQSVKLDFSGSAGTTTQTVPASGDWVRLRDTQGGAVGAGQRYFYVQSLNNATLDVDVWGEQVELGTFATSYIPTPSSSTVTRATDLCSMEGTNFSSWYNQSEGTLVSNWVSPDDTSKIYSGLVNIKSSTAKGSPGIAVYTFLGLGIMRDIYGTVTGSSVDWQNAVTANTPLKLAITYDASEQATTYNGNTPQSTSITTAVPTMVRMDMGDHYAINDRYSNGHISRIAYYNTRLSNTTLEALTK